MTGAVGTTPKPVIPPMLYLPCDGFRSGGDELSASALDELDLHQPYDVILLDVEIPTELRRKPGE
jgi:hypothetical protein